MFRVFPYKSSSFEIDSFEDTDTLVVDDDIDITEEPEQDEIDFSDPFTVPEDCTLSAVESLLMSSKKLEGLGTFFEHFFK